MTGRDLVACSCLVANLFAITYSTLGAAVKKKKKLGKLGSYRHHRPERHFRNSHSVPIIRTITIQHHRHHHTDYGYGINKTPFFVSSYLVEKLSTNWTRRDAFDFILLDSAKG